MKNIFTILFVTFCSIAIFNSCSSSTGPEETYKDPREMTWTCDTLMYPNSLQTILTSIYVSSPSNIWACGHGNNSEGLWHFNGLKWEPYNLYHDIAPGSLELVKLHGFNSNDIWLVGNRTIWYNGNNSRSYKPLILRYQNGKWNEIKPTINNLNTRILSICGNSSNDLWMGCDNGIILHYLNGQWSADTLRIRIPDTTGGGIGSIVIYNGKPFIMLSLNDATLHYIKTYFYTGTEKNWQLVDSSIIDQNQFYNNGGDEELFVSDTEKLFSYGDEGIWEWENSKWNKVLNGQMFIAGMRGMGDNYIFAVGNPSYFYDGTRWNRLDFLESKNGENLLYTDIWTDGKEVLITGLNTGGFPNKTHMWHGK